MFHHNWVKTAGRVLDSRIRTMYNPRTGSGTISDSIALHSYIVEFRAPNGETTEAQDTNATSPRLVVAGADQPPTGSVAAASPTAIERAAATTSPAPISDPTNKTGWRRLVSEQRDGTELALTGRGHTPPERSGKRPPKRTGSDRLPTGVAHQAAGRAAPSTRGPSIRPLLLYAYTGHGVPVAASPQVR